MNLQVTPNSVSPTSSVQSTASRPQERREAFQQLSQAVASDDLVTARQAYADVLRNAPPRATWNAGSSFAQIGKALVAGDMSAALEAFGEMRDRLEHNPLPTTPQSQSSAPALSSTGGVAGSKLDVLA